MIKPKVKNVKIKGCGNHDLGFMGVLRGLCRGSASIERVKTKIYGI